MPYAPPTSSRKTASLEKSVTHMRCPACSSAFSCSLKAGLWPGSTDRRCCRPSSFSTTSRTLLSAALCASSSDGGSEASCVLLATIASISVTASGPSSSSRRAARIASRVIISSSSLARASNFAVSPSSPCSRSVRSMVVCLRSAASCSSSTRSVPGEAASCAVACRASFERRRAGRPMTTTAVASKAAAAPVPAGGMRPVGAGARRPARGPGDTAHLSSALPEATRAQDGEARGPRPAISAAAVQIIEASGWQGLA
mmetsp:Transcript_80051/g.226553  ORF Transcript_80051/g.226553 Transcript_80051/m.226553 type:complete len:257 (-) Transcript_80051:8-778(-)